MSEIHEEQMFLDAGIAKLQPLLVANGFEYRSGDQGVSSAGPFATGLFHRGNLELGLIVRFGNRLGCPNYSLGHGYAGHHDLFRALRRTKEMSLVPDDGISYKARDGGDPFDALLADLERVILPEMRSSYLNFLEAISRAHQRFQDRLFGIRGRTKPRE